MSYFVAYRNVWVFFVDNRNDIWHQCFSCSGFVTNPGNYICYCSLQVFIFNKHLSHDTLFRSFRLHIASIYTYIYNTSLQQLFTSQNRYCEEAVKGVKNVTSCPTSKTEWDIAALRKNCSEIAPRQNCVNEIEKFQYHCVINGLRNKLVEVCAPTRIIFGIFYFL